MLESLFIKNIALIEELEIKPEKGLNCITGETGAGKSVVVDSIGFVLGARSYRDLIRTGSESCLVSAVFQPDSVNINRKLQEIGITPEEDNTILLSRELTLAGKNNCRINGHSVTLSILRTIGEFLIDIHGQHDNRRLMEPETHREMVDLYGEKEILPIYEKYRTLLEEYNDLKGKLSEGNTDPLKRQERIDLLTFQISEIEMADIKENEWEELKNRKEKLLSAEKIVTSLGKSSEALSGSYDSTGACEMIAAVVKLMNSIGNLDETYKSIAERTESLSYELEDISREIRNLSDDFFFTPEELSETEDRLEVIEKLNKKYGNIQEYYDKACKELDELNQGEEYVQKLIEKISYVYEKLTEAGVALRDIRKEIGKNLSEEVKIQLNELEMPGVSFSVEVNIEIPEKPVNLTDRWPAFEENGIDSVEFLISANRGEPLKPVAKIASGGELSRIMLAIKTILADTDNTPTLIFDEIDVGISGKAAGSVAEKLKKISGIHQVMCVTHSTQIAVKADCNILLKKDICEGRTLIGCEILDKEGKIREIARLLDGNPDSPVALGHAKSLLEKA
ncbi:MAG: DNA repair protein RecN [Ruminococcaceae bacterium]|nr:DNA repair protein RecN [Oscillospiraceae bacterium]